MTARWQTPDAAIREVRERPFLRARAIDYASPRTGTAESAAEVVHAHTQVWAVLGEYSDEEQAVLEGYAFGLSYRAMARKMRCSDWKVRQIHKACWPEVRDRLVDLGLVSEGA